MLGATFLYIGGMFLNDAFDVEFDQAHRQARPIPSGDISAKTVWALGFLWLGLGEAILCFLGRRTAIAGVGLAMAIVLYDALHKRISFAPVLMGLCRFLLYVTAASVTTRVMRGWVVWCGFALAAYIIGLSYLARRESSAGLNERKAIRHWPLLLLGAPIVLALVLNAGPYREGALLLSLVMFFWSIRCLRQTLWSAEPNIGRTVAGLLAGIVLVDWLAIADAPRQFGFVFIGLFLTAVCFQRFIPAT